MNLSDAVHAYLNSRATMVARNTHRNDKRALLLLLADAGNIDTKSLRPQHLDTYWLRRTTWGAATQNQAAISLAGFFKWCQSRGYMRRDVDLLEGRRRQRVPEAAHIIIPQSEFQSLLESIDCPRARAVTALGLYLFTRIGESASLRWQDLNFDTDTIEVYREKTGKMDTLPMCAELRSEMLRWRMAYAARMGEQVRPGWFLFPALDSRRGRSERGRKGFVALAPQRWLPTTKPNLASTIRKVLEDAGYYKPREGGHTFRRSGATALYEHLSYKGHDRAIRICQAMLGHAHITTTEVYLHLSVDRKERNALLAGRSMFDSPGEGAVVQLGSRTRGQEGDRDVRV